MDTKKIIGALLVWIWIGHGATAQPDSIKQVLDSSITLLRTHALHGQRPDWDYVRERAYELAGEATRWEDLGPAISWLFQAVNDHHGWLAVGNTTLRWERAEPPFLSEALKKELTKDGHIVQKMLPGGIGYLRVAGMTVGLADSLARLEAGGARKLIIDLRLARGESPGGPATAGNTALSGISPLPGTRTPVVVLTGHGTGSAGESIAVAFKGRKHTIFIGEPTGGYCTAINGYWIVEGRVRIAIAETRLARNLIPDEWVPGGDDFEDDSKDKKMQTAVSWLKDFH